MEYLQEKGEEILRLAGTLGRKRKREENVDEEDLKDKDVNKREVVDLTSSPSPSPAPLTKRTDKDDEDVFGVRSLEEKGGKGRWTKAENQALWLGQVCFGCREVLTSLAEVWRGKELDGGHKAGQ